MPHTWMIVVIALMFVSCSSSRTTLLITMVRHECGGAMGQALATEVTPRKGEVFYISRNNSKLKQVAADKTGSITIKGSKGEVKLFISEKVKTDIQLSGEACDRWRITPDASFTLQKGEHTLPVYFEVICNPCLLPRP
ncbi:MAG: hypothetical protein ACK4KT_00895 [Thermaurantimonas sp.]